MNKNNQKIAELIKVNISKVDEAINNLSELDVFVYVYTALSERVFNRILESPVENKSDYLQGAHDVLELMSSLPEIFLEVTKDSINPYGNTGNFAPLEDINTLRNKGKNSEIV